MLRMAQILPAPITVSLEKRQSSPFRPRSILPRRLRGHFYGLLFLATIAFFLHYSRSSTSTSTPDNQDELLPFLRGLPKPEGGRKPPRFYEWHDREKRLPQHDVNLPYPQGREGRYIRFTNRVSGTLSFLLFRGCGAARNIITELIGRLSDEGVGWGNAMQEMLFNAHLAYLSERTYVHSTSCLVIYLSCVGTCLTTTLGTSHQAIFQLLMVRIRSQLGSP